MTPPRAQMSLAAADSLAKGGSDLPLQLPPRALSAGQPAQITRPIGVVFTSANPGHLGRPGSNRTAGENKHEYRTRVY
eukprot:CAMPEP_0205927928 /NCGR_PEP_ID=MMETSP1325-20131115/23675_1 /ASSEMBLY_ACC=CAM_ASM_000708 /TAXON_ID=236786 /ORGANISM="Florenciella sp., Strain RCC1007" /LENGTH=77 /DNA_ID=CAMNT_0053296879 /DNA_START=112 /DNA_END=342 /DNA_ORIENTATION=+